MRFLGAKVVLTNPAHKGSGMVLKSQELAKHHGWFRPCQFENEANAHIHETTTGPELLAAMGQAHIDMFVCAYGTGGTLKGISTALKKHSAKTKVHFRGILRAYTSYVLLLETCTFLFKNPRWWSVSQTMPRSSTRKCPPNMASRTATKSRSSRRTPAGGRTCSKAGRPTSFPCW